MLVLSAKATREEQADQEAVPRQCERSANSGSLGTLLWGSNLCTCLRNLPVSLFIFVSIALASMCPKADHNLQQFSGQHWTPITSFTSFWVSNVIMLLSQPRWTLRCFAALGSVTAGVAVSFYIPNRQILSNFDPTFWFQVSDYIIIYRIHILTLQYTTVHYHIIYVYIYISIILYIHRCTSHIVYITYAHICIYIHHNCLHIYIYDYIYMHNAQSLSHYCASRSCVSTKKVPHAPNHFCQSFKAFAMRNN